MTRRKPLPYAAGQLIDEALMENSDALREIRPMIHSKQVTLEELVLRLAAVVDHLHRSSEALRRAKEIRE